MYPNKILMVENDPGWIESARSFFSRSEVLADDGVAFDRVLLENHDIDLVLIDYDLGRDRPTGREVLKALRQQQRGGCLGLFSEIGEGGFLARDANEADFYIDKGEFFDRSMAFTKVLESWNACMRSRCRPSVRSEWGKLRTVLVHTPTTELRYVDAEDPFFLMEERPDEERAAAEHRDFVTALRREAGAVVLDVRDLLTDVFEQYEDEETRAALLAEIVFDAEERRIRELFGSSKVPFPHLGTQAIEDAKSLPAAELVRFVYEGWSSSNWRRYETNFGRQHVSLLPEMNNSYFTRDPGFSLDELFVVSSMTKRVRQREPRVLEVVLRHHPWFEGAACESFASSSVPQRIEGGDVVAIGPRRLAIGWSERTSFETIEGLAKTLLIARDYEEVYAIPIPRRRAFMHLDTVFSLVGSETAVVYPEAMEISLGFSVLRASPGKNGGPSLSIEQVNSSFIDYLRSEHGFSIVETAGGDAGLSRAEQFTDATNCLAIGEKRVVGYRGNRATNEALAKAGVEVIAVDGYELVKGRGGPRCMTMPVMRD